MQKRGSLVLLMLLALSTTSLTQTSSPDASAENMSYLDISFEQDKSFIQIPLNEIRLENTDAGRIVAIDPIGELPLHVVLLMDVSGSRKFTLSVETQLFAEIIKSLPLRDIDSACLIAFNQSIRVLQDFTSNKALLLKGMESVFATGGTSLLDSIYYASNKLSSFKNSRKAIIVFTDGDDRDSQVSIMDVYGNSIAGNVRIYMFCLKNPKATNSLFPRDRTDYVAKHRKYVEGTGGKVFPFSTLDNALRQVPAIVDELSHLERISIAHAQKQPPDFKISVTRKGIKAYYPSVLK